MGYLIQKMKETSYRLKLRKALLQSSTDELHICLEECRKEINRRNKQK